jgi:uncharacterized membrane protein
MEVTVISELYAWNMVLEKKNCFVSQVNVPQVVLCVLASQIANFGESLIGATLQDKDGFEWVS